MKQSEIANIYCQDPKEHFSIIEFCNLTASCVKPGNMPVGGVAGGCCNYRTIVPVESGYVNREELTTSQKPVVGTISQHFST